MLLTCCSFSLLAQVASFKIIERQSAIAEMVADNRDTTANSKIKVTIKGKEGNYYKTVSMSNYLYIGEKKDTLVAQRKRLLAELYTNVDSEEVRVAKIKKIDTLDYKIIQMQKEQKSLYNAYTVDYLLYKKVNIFNFGFSRATAFYDIVYNNENTNFRVLNSAGLNFGNNTGSVYSELASGNLGVFRVNLAAMAANNSNPDPAASKVEEAFQRLQTNGGNLVMNMEYPLAYLHSRNNKVNFLTRFILRGSADFPEFGTNTDDFAGSVAAGLDLYGEAPLSNNALSFFFNLNVNQYYGSNTFIDNLGISSTNFTFGQLTLGIVVSDNLKLSFIVGSFSSEESLRNGNVTIGGQVLK